jgi:hypothetical protein
MKLEKYILAKATDQNKLIQAVQALANLYAESSFADEIKVNRISYEDHLFVILFPKQPDFECFKYFVNYLHYPEKGNAGNETKGYWTVGDQDELPERLIGSRVMLYVSENDEEHDNVYSAFDSIPENYKLGFAMGEEFVKLSNSEPSFSEISIEETDLELITIVKPDNEALEKRNKSKGIGCLSILPVILIVLGIIYVL